MFGADKQVPPRERCEGVNTAEGAPTAPTTVLSERSSVDISARTARACSPSCARAVARTNWQSTSCSYYSDTKTNLNGGQDMPVRDQRPASHSHVPTARPYPDVLGGAVPGNGVLAELPPETRIADDWSLRPVKRDLYALQTAQVEHALAAIQALHPHSPSLHHRSRQPPPAYNTRSWPHHRRGPHDGGTVLHASSSASRATATRSIATASRAAAQSLAAVCITTATSSGYCALVRAPRRHEGGSVIAQEVPSAGTECA